MLHFCVCEHRADVPCQKGPVLSRLSVGHSPRSFVACQHDVLGRGSFGTVAKCQNMHTNSTEAVKVNGSAPMFMDLAFKEISFLKRLRCLDADTCNIVKWNGYFFHKQSICMTFEVLDQSLKAYLEERGMLHQLVTALAHIHSIGVLHLDLKPDNVMVVDCTQQPVRVKIIDFGLAGLLSEVKVGERRGTPSYMAPEMMLAAPFDETFDMWSLGVIAAELAMGCMLYPAYIDYDALSNIVETQGQPPDDILDRGMRTPMFFCPGHHSDQQSLLSLIKSMLHLDAGQRVKAREALQHPFFAPGVQHKEDEGVGHSPFPESPMVRVPPCCSSPQRARGSPLCDCVLQRGERQRTKRQFRVFGLLGVTGWCPGRGAAWGLHSSPGGQCSRGQ
uniref:Protein kinase domain-containing protein n=1 Tax=Stegastes partitus TaxID=144197 RepID=A0A3B5ABC8_9TELE